MSHRYVAVRHCSLDPVFHLPTVTTGFDRWLLWIQQCISALHRLLGPRPYLCPSIENTRSSIYRRSYKAQPHAVVMHSQNSLKTQKRSRGNPGHGRSALLHWLGWASFLYVEATAPLPLPLRRRIYYDQNMCFNNIFVKNVSYRREQFSVLRQVGQPQGWRFAECSRSWHSTSYSWIPHQTING